VYTRLDLTGANVQSLRGELCYYGQVRELYCADNAIDDLSPLHELKALVLVDASKNALTSVAAFGPYVVARKHACYFNAA
jgi:Leucine-rich repeat (LRR) protein